MMLSGLRLGRSQLDSRVAPHSFTDAVGGMYWRKECCFLSRYFTVLQYLHVSKAHAIPSLTSKSSIFPVDLREYSNNN